MSKELGLMGYGGGVRVLWVVRERERKRERKRDRALQGSNVHNVGVQGVQLSHHQLGDRPCLPYDGQDRVNCYGGNASARASGLF